VRIITSLLRKQHFRIGKIINCMRVNDLDAFALRTYSFTLRRTNRYFSLPTILLSLAIVLAALRLSQDSLAHLWLPRAQLPILSSRKLEFPEPLSSTLVCFRAKDPAAALPTARIYNTQN
jgi:hypothetical protein